MRYFFDQDNDGQWFLIEADFRDEWEAWVNSDSDNPPGFSYPLGSHPKWVEFSDPKEVF